MASERRTIHVKADTALLPLLDEATEEPILLERGGAFFRLEACEPADEWADYDPAKVIAALDATAGALSEEEAAALVTDLYLG